MKKKEAMAQNRNNASRHTRSMSNLPRLADGSALTQDEMDLLATIKEAPEETNPLIFEQFQKAINIGIDKTTRELQLYMADRANMMSPAEGILPGTRGSLEL